MEPQYLLVGAIAGAGMGYACGLIPQHTGKTIGRAGAGNAALAACVAMGAVLGCLGALPLALILSAVIKGMGEPVDPRRVAKFDPHGRRIPKARYTVAGRTIVCNRCKQATDRMPDGSVPTECPDCQLVFEETPTVRPARPDRFADSPAVEVSELEAAEPGRRTAT